VSASSPSDRLRWGRLIRADWRCAGSAYARAYPSARSSASRRRRTKKPTHGGGLPASGQPGQLDFHGVISGNTIVLVDAGFLIKALLLQADKKYREEVAIDYEALAEVLASLASDETGARVLRQTWYDGARGARPRAEHQALAEVPGVHVRLGWIIDTSHGPQQKAVDTMMVRDIVVAAIHHVADDLVLIAGDGDLVPGVREAIDRGLRIHLWGVSVEDPRVQQSSELIALADRRLTIDLADLSPHVRDRERDQPSSRVDTSETPAAPDDSEAPLSHQADLILDLEVDPVATGAALPIEELTTSGHVLRPSDGPRAEQAQIGPPPLRQLSTPQQREQDRSEDLDEDLEKSPQAYDVAARYGSRWWTRASDEIRERLLTVARRPRLPRLLDADLLQYAVSRAIATNDEQVRRDLRAGFWRSID